MIRDVYHALVPKAIQRKAYNWHRNKMKAEWEKKYSNAVYPKITQKHIQHTIILENRYELLNRLMKHGVVAEIGVDRGDFSKEILKFAKPSSLHLVDSWASERYGATKMKAVKERFASEIVEGLVKVHQSKSVQAAAIFKEQYFDWVYIDTDHSYETTKAELESYASKVKSDGIIAGHDFIIGNWAGMVRYGVIEAVYEFCTKYDWEIIYITADIEEYPSFAIRRIQHIQ